MGNTIATGNALVNLSLWSQNPNGSTSPAIWNKTTQTINKISMSVTDTAPTVTDPKTYEITSSFNVIIGSTKYIVAFDVIITYSKSGAKSIKQLSGLTVTDPTGKFIVPFHCDVTVSNITSGIGSIPTLSRDYIKKTSAFDGPGVVSTYQGHTYTGSPSDPPINCTLSGDTGMCSISSSVPTYLVNDNIIDTTNNIATYQRLVTQTFNPLPLMSDNVSPYIDNIARVLTIKVPGSVGSTIKFEDRQDFYWPITATCPASVNIIPGNAVACGAALVRYGATTSVCFYKAKSYNWDMTPPQ